ncbi:hypothetical protein [Kitasatospora mediocidica]|uniref:hypothetical protein n=1 Tax=Kitasatospora mediocidica TaxID=58352 RepID=UPI00055D549A|nr:hypothetical protein [Kitasatospora mediocidica]
MSTDHDLEDDFADGFARALQGAAELAPEVLGHRLTAGAQQYGRRWRRRRRTAVAGGLAVLVLAGAGGFMAVGRGPSRTAGPVGTVSQKPVPMSEQEVVSLVTALLPPGKVSVITAGGTGQGAVAGSGTGGTLMFDDGAGASIFEYRAERTDLTPAAGAVCMDGFTMPQDSCDRTELPGGAVMVIDKLRSQNTPGGLEWRATWAAPDGRRVSVIEYNGQPAGADRPNPPLSSQQLTAFVTAASWERVFAALAPVKNAPAPATPTPVAGPSAAELLTKLVRMLPAGATSSTPKGSDQADLTVTLDGRTSMVQVGVDPASDKGKQAEASTETSPSTPLEVREKLADGTLVVTNRFGNGKTATDPVLHWTADVYYPDGRHVSLYEWNGENGYTARPGTPALSPEQLKAIATDPAWRS